MLPDDPVSVAVRDMLIESEGGLVDMDLVEFICALRDSEMSSEEFKKCLVELYKEYNKEMFT